MYELIYRMETTFKSVVLTNPKTVCIHSPIYCLLKITALACVLSGKWKSHYVLVFLPVSNHSKICSTPQTRETVIYSSISLYFGCYYTNMWEFL